jgi:cytochrome c5
MNRTVTMLIVVAMTGALLAALPAPVKAEQKGSVRSIELPLMQFELAGGPDRELVNRYCGICHGVEYVPMQPGLSKAQWTATVTKMIKAFGAPVPQEDADKIVGYLGTAYGTGQ